jgi:predicted metallopeptidase
MAKKPKVYSRVIEADEMVQELCKKYPDVLWQVKPAMVTVLGVENKERPPKSKTLAKVKVVTGTEKALLKINGIGIRYVIDLYFSDWNVWKPAFKQWVILHELLHIAHEEDKVIKHDIEDFKIILDAVGVNWATGEKDLPNLLTTDVKFNLDLRPGLEEAEEEAEEKDEEDKD